MVARLHPLGLRWGSSPCVQYVHIKQHEASSRQQTDSTTTPAAALFVCGLPLSATNSALVSIFSCFGQVQQAALHPTKRSAIVLFTEAAATKAALQAARQGQLVELPQHPDEEANADDTPKGLKAWVVAHKAARPPLDQLQAQLDDWTEQHEAEEAARVQAQKAAMGDDGWTVVVRSKGRKRTKEDGGIVSQSGGVALAAAQSLAASKQAPKLEKFYKFQQRDKRRSELMELRHRFDQDRKRIASLRATRNFRPL